MSMRSEPTKIPGYLRRMGVFLAGLQVSMLLGASTLPAEGMSREELSRLWDSIQRLSEVVSPATPSVRVRLEPSKITVPHWEQSVRLSVEVTGLRNLAAFFAELEFGSGLSVAPDDFVSAGPLWTQFGTPQADDEIPPATGYGENGVASIFGVSPRRAISGDGTLAVLQFSIEEPGSATVKLTDFLWMEAGESRVMRKAELLGSAQVEIVKQEPVAYLSFVPPAADTPAPRDGSPVQRQVEGGVPVPVYVCVKGLAGVNGLTFSVDFDHQGLEFIGTRKGELIRSAGKSLGVFDCAERANKKGQLLDQGIALLDPGPGIRGGGCLAELLFLARGTPSATIRLRSVAAVEPGAEPRRREIEVQDSDIPLTVTRLR